MNSIEKITGLSIEKSGNGLIFDDSLTKPSFQEKSYFEYKDFFQDKTLDKDITLYYIYRNVSLLKDLELFEKFNLRYDLTLIFPNNIGGEINHTVGHAHKKNDKGYPYTEIYQVIEGSAIFLLQKEDMSIFYAIHAESGEKVIIPPGFGHITVNKSNTKYLLISNIFTREENVSEYSFFKSHSGAMWYPKMSSSNEISFEMNPEYKIHTGIVELKSNDVKNIESFSGKSLYLEFINHPDKFGFINHPENFENILTIDK